MSSILRALKKLEDQNREEQIFQPWTGNPDLKKSVNTRIKSRRFFLIFLPICVAVSLIAIPVWLTFNHNPVSEKRFSQDSRPIESITEEVSVSSTSQEKPKQGESVLPVEERRTQPAPSPDIAQKGIEEANPLPRKDPPPRVRKQPLEKERDPILSRKPAVSEQADEKMLELQAIAWSNVPEERIAIINGKIVREGEPIDGFFVSRIESEVVFVKEGTSEKKIMFKLK